MVAILEMHVRPAEPRDIPGIVAVIRSPGLFARIGAEPPEVTRQHVAAQLALCQAADSHLVLVAQTPGGEIAGYAAVHWLPYLIHAGPEGYVSELFIRPEYRGQGIGGWLLAEIKREAQRRGCSRLMLLNMRERESYQRQF